MSLELFEVKGLAGWFYTVTPPPSGLVTGAAFPPPPEIMSLNKVNEIHLFCYPTK